MVTNQEFYRELVDLERFQRYRMGRRPYCDSCGKKMTEHEPQLQIIYDDEPGSVKIFCSRECEKVYSRAREEALKRQKQKQKASEIWQEHGAGWPG